LIFCTSLCVLNLEVSLSIFFASAIAAATSSFAWAVLLPWMVRSSVVSMAKTVGE